MHILHCQKGLMRDRMMMEGKQVVGVKDCKVAVQLKMVVSVGSYSWHMWLGLTIKDGELLCRGSGVGKTREFQHSGGQCNRW